MARNAICEDLAQQFCGREPLLGLHFQQICLVCRWNWDRWPNFRDDNAADEQATLIPPYVVYGKDERKGEGRLPNGQFLRQTLISTVHLSGCKKHLKIGLTVGRRGSSLCPTSANFGNLRQFGRKHQDETQ